MVYLKRKAGLGKTNQARNFTCLILVILPINLMKIKKLEHVLLRPSSYEIFWSLFKYFCRFKLQKDIYSQIKLAVSNIVKNK